MIYVVACVSTSFLLTAGYSLSYGETSDGLYSAVKRKVKKLKVHLWVGVSVASVCYE